MLIENKEIPQTLIKALGAEKFEGIISEIQHLRPTQSYKAIMGNSKVYFALDLEKDCIDLYYDNGKYRNYSAISLLKASDIDFVLNHINEEIKELNINIDNAST